MSDTKFYPLAVRNNRRLTSSHQNKRALGVTKAKRRVSKKTGIPLSRGGRRMRLGKWMGMK